MAERDGEHRVQERCAARTVVAGWPSLVDAEAVSEVFTILGLWPNVLLDDPKVDTGVAVWELSYKRRNGY